MTKPDKHQRSVLPIPDVRKPGLTTFDAKDPDSRFPPIETVVPPAGATEPVHASKFTGKIHWVQLDVGVDDNDHFISPEERLRVAMARQ